MEELTGVTKRDDNVSYGERGTDYKRESVG